MKYFFLGLLWSPISEYSIKKKLRKQIVYPSEKFQWSLIHGLDHVLNDPLTIINFLPVGSYPKYCSFLFLHSKEWSHSENAHDYEIGSINLPILKQLWRIISLRLKLNRLISKSREPITIFLYSMYLPFLLAIKGIHEDIKIVCIVTDLPEYYDLERVGSLRTILRYFNNRIIYNNLKRINGYVMLTKQMSKVLGVDNKPQIVIEGIIDPELHIRTYNEKKENAILYSGTLNYKYGIKEFLEAFRMIRNNSINLWICGAGEAENYIINASKTDPRIKYFGVLDWSELALLQQRARLLVNPRMNIGEYTKYSFPSKMMEYLASGTPVIAYKLDGIPEEYYRYVYWLEPGTKKDIASQIELLTAKSDEELIEFGRSARNFVLAEKNQDCQALKIIRAFKEKR